VTTAREQERPPEFPLGFWGPLLFTVDFWGNSGRLDHPDFTICLVFQYTQKDSNLQPSVP
jgi:hypothetical protein